jgi:hypothetical protein
LADKKEKAIEKVQLPAKVQLEAVEDDLSEADLESVAGGTVIDACHTLKGAARGRRE